MIKYEKFVNVVYSEKIQIYVFDYEYLNSFNEMINVVKKKVEIILLKKYRKLVDVCNKQNADILSQHNCFNYAIKINFFFSNSFTICR